MLQPNSIESTLGIPGPFRTVTPRGEDDAAAPLLSQTVYRVLSRHGMVELCSVVRFLGRVIMSGGSSRVALSWAVSHLEMNYLG